MAPCNGTQQWHHVHSPKVGRHPPPDHSTLQWHPAMAPLPAPTIAHYNGTVQWHHVHSPKLVVTLPPKNSTLQWHSNGTTSSAPCNGTLVPRPIRQSGSSPSPPIGSKNPYSYRYLGKKFAEGCENLYLFCSNWIWVRSFRPSARATLLPTDVFPTPGGPTRPEETHGKIRFNIGSTFSLKHMVNPCSETKNHETDIKGMSPSSLAMISQRTLWDVWAESPYTWSCPGWNPAGGQPLPTVKGAFVWKNKYTYILGLHSAFENIPNTRWFQSSRHNSKISSDKHTTCLQEAHCDVLQDTFLDIFQAIVVLHYR